MIPLPKYQPVVPPTAASVPTTCTALARQAIAIQEPARTAIGDRPLILDAHAYEEMYRERWNWCRTIETEQRYALMADSSAVRQLGLLQQWRE